MRRPSLQPAERSGFPLARMGAARYVLRPSGCFSVLEANRSEHKAGLGWAPPPQSSRPRGVWPLLLALLQVPEQEPSLGRGPEIRHSSFTPRPDTAKLLPLHPPRADTGTRQPDRGASRLSAPRSLALCQARQAPHLCILSGVETALS